MSFCSTASQHSGFESLWMQLFFVLCHDHWDLVMGKQSCICDSTEDAESVKMGKRSHWSKSEAHYQFVSFIIKWVSLLMLRFTPFSLPFIEVDKNKRTSWKRKLCWECVHVFALLRVAVEVQRSSARLKTGRLWVWFPLGAGLFSSAIFSNVSLNRSLEEVQHYCFSY